VCFSSLFLSVLFIVPPRPRARAAGEDEHAKGKRNDVACKLAGRAHDEDTAMNIWVHRHNNYPRDDVNADLDLNYNKSQKTFGPAVHTRASAHAQWKRWGRRKLKAVAAALLEYTQYTPMQDEVPKP